VRGACVVLLLVVGCDRAPAPAVRVEPEPPAAATPVDPQVAALPIEAPPSTQPSVACAEGSPSPVADLDARAIGALRAEDRDTLQALGARELDVTRAMGVGVVPDETPYMGCSVSADGLVTSYAGMDGGAHELRLTWRWEADAWRLASVAKYGW
jgi:hypothetical protein